MILACSVNAAAAASLCIHNLLSHHLAAAPKTGKLLTGMEFDGLETTAANGLRACREGKCNRERCSDFQIETNRQIIVARWG